MDLRLSSPSAERNREPILDVLRRVLPAQGRVLEVASGTGQHAAWFAEHMPSLMFRPSDPDPTHRDSIEAWRQHAACKNLLAPLALDVTESDWELHTDIPTPLDALLCINMIHIAPWAATLGLLRGAESLLASGGLLFLYGPYQRHGTHTAPSNAAFDSSLRQRNPDWGVRDLEQVTKVARSHVLERVDVIAMPANNLSVVFQRDAR